MWTLVIIIVELTRSCRKRHKIHNSIRFWRVGSQPGRPTSLGGWMLRLSGAVAGRFRWSAEVRVTPKKSILANSLLPNDPDVLVPFIEFAHLVPLPSKSVVHLSPPNSHYSTRGDSFLKKHSKSHLSSKTLHSNSYELKINWETRRSFYQELTALQFWTLHGVLARGSMSWVAIQDSNVSTPQGHRLASHGHILWYREFQKVLRIAIEAGHH